MTTPAKRDRVRLDPIDTYTTRTGALIERWTGVDDDRPERITIKRRRTPDAPPELFRVMNFRTTTEADAAWAALVPTRSAR